MFTKPSHQSLLLTSGSTRKTHVKQSWRLHATAPSAHLLIGVVISAMALPLGLNAAVLAPVAAGFAKGMFCHFCGDEGVPTHFAWIILGSAIVACFARLNGLN